MAPKKAAKKAGKKAAKKAARHGGAQDLRRAYEHLHRVSLMHEQVGSEARRQIDLLSRYAETALGTQEFEPAADLLRAAEHICFGSIASTSRERKLNDNLARAAREEYEHLTERANKHWKNHEESADLELRRIFSAALEAAEDAFHAGAMYRALEYARAADALAELEPSKAKLLQQPGQTDKRLRS